MKILALYKKDPVTREIVSAEELVLRAGHGIEGDANAMPGSFRQVLLASRPHIEALQIPENTLKANVIVDGIIEEWPSGTGVTFSGGGALRLVYECEPCYQLDEQVPGLAKRVHGKRGRLASVEASGVLRVGDTLHARENRYSPIPENIFDRVGYFVRQIPAGKVVTFETLRLACGISKTNLRVMPLYLKRNIGKALVHRVVTTAGMLIERHLPGQEAMLREEGLAVVGGVVEGRRVVLAELV